jgi:hypothetical protein
MISQGSREKESWRARGFAGGGDLLVAFRWFDAVCINQRDNDEKSQQVSQMGEVYKIATHTIINLGEATDESDLVLGMVDAWGAVPRVK